MSRPPEILARFDERPRLAALPGGELVGLFLRWGPEGQEVACRRSTDAGATWTEPGPLLPLPMAPGHWGGCQVVVDGGADLHAFLLNDRHTGVFPDAQGQREAGPAGARRLDIWHSRTDGDIGTWRPPQCIWQGYTGSLNGGLCTSRGRLVLPFARLTSRTWRERGEGLDAFWFSGTSSSLTVYSDDGGDTWHPSPSELKVQTPSIGTYGAVEPVVVELADGRLWMLIRTQVGRFYESFSEDGSRWSQPRPTHLINSDSPAGMVRLADGRLVLLWNKCRRYPYAHGGRHVLHGAVSTDEGETWIGHREVARDPHRDEPPPPGGDHGTAYPYPLALPDGTVLVTTGQGAGRVCIVRIDPDWLSESQHQWPQHGSPGPGDDAAEQWSVFGCKGVEFAAAEGGDPRLTVARTESEWPAAAVWNFPLSRRGDLHLRVRARSLFGGALLMLTDHFSVPFDPEDVLDAVVAVHLTPGAGEASGQGAAGTGADGFAAGDTPGPRAAGPRRLPPGVGHAGLTSGSWRDLTLEWDLDAGEARLRTDSGEVLDLPIQRVADGLCYLRLKSIADNPDGGLELASVRAARR